MVVMNVANLAKPILIITNTISCGLGIAFTVLGSWIAFDFTAMMRTFFNQDSFGNESNEKVIKQQMQCKDDEKVALNNVGSLNSSLAAVFIPLIIVGILIILQNIVGCVGACKEIKRLLKPYLIFVNIVMFIEIGGLALVVFEWDSLLDSIKGVFESRLKLYGTNCEIKRFWDNYMNREKCCGVNDGSDFLHVAQLNESESLPRFCCEDYDNDDDCSVFQANKDEQPGCIKEFIDDHLKMFRFDIAILSLEIFLKLLGAIATFIILRYVDKGGKEYWDWKIKSNSRNYHA